MSKDIFWCSINNSTKFIVFVIEIDSAHVGVENQMNATPMQWNSYLAARDGLHVSMDTNYGRSHAENSQSNLYCDFCALFLTQLVQWKKIIYMLFCIVMVVFSHVIVS